jgi:hypothetical protein
MVGMQTDLVCFYIMHSDILLVSYFFGTLLWHYCLVLSLAVILDSEPRQFNFDSLIVFYLLNYACSLTTFDYKKIILSFDKNLEQLFYFLSMKPNKFGTAVGRWNFIKNLHFQSRCHHNFFQSTVIPKTHLIKNR